MNNNKQKLIEAIEGSRFSTKIDGVTIYLPTPQKTGTHYQRRAYAEQAADKILLSLTKDPTTQNTYRHFD